MMKLYISQPMRGLSDEQILEERRAAQLEAERIMGQPLELIDSLLSDCSKGPVWCLGRSICLMQDADVVYFARGWKEARGCRAEYVVAREYGIKRLRAQDIN